MLRFVIWKLKSGKIKSYSHVGHVRGEFRDLDSAVKAESRALSKISRENGEDGCIVLMPDNKVIFSIKNRRK